MRAGRCLTTILALTVLLAGTAQAQAPASAAAMDMEGTLELDAGMLALVLHTRGGGIEEVALEAESAQMLRWTRTGAYVDCWGTTCVPQQSLQLELDPERVPSAPARDVQLRLLGADAVSRLAIMPEGPGALGFQGTQLSLRSQDGACMTGVEFAEASADCVGYDAKTPGFTQLPLDGALQLINATRGHEIVLRGDMVLELEGVSLRDGELLMDTQHARSGGAAGVYERYFGRILLEDAVLRIGFSSPAVATWAVRDAAVLAQDGQIVLQEANGLIQLASGPRTLRGEEVLTGDFLLRSQATPGAISFGIEPHNEAGQSVVAAAGFDSRLPWTLTALASLLPLAGVAMVVARRQAHTSMRDVEQCLQRGRYGRASRLAKRILRLDPRHETAQLSQAIALTRAGRPAEAVRRARGYLARHDPLDGTLHYALGVALVELQRDDEAREAMAAAALRTPSLVQEMAPDLRPSQDGAYT